MTVPSNDLAGIADSVHSLVSPWETRWHLFGPIANSGTTMTWPGEIGFSPLPLDGVTCIPAQVQLGDVLFHPREVISTGGRLALSDILPTDSGCPIAYAMTIVNREAAGTMPLTFSACWGTQWWLNGKLIHATEHGNPGEPDDWTVNQLVLPMRAGENLLCVKVVAGLYDQWSICFGRPEADVESQVERAPMPEALPVTGGPRRDYAAAGLRIEQRPGPVPVAEAKNREAVMAAHGVQAHWIGIVDHTGSPYAESAALPPGEHARPGNRELLRAQVEEIHAAGMAAVTWFPGNHCKSAAELHPEWCTKLLHDAGHGGEANYCLCINSPYGEALTDFVLESLDYYGLDGFWFDGTSWSHPGTVGCVCSACGAAFHKATGLALPQAVDWEQEAFRQWVAWRYRSYMTFWGRLASCVRRSFPGARIVVNHRHRLCHGWEMGIPIDRYEADVVAGTESQHDPFISAFHSRLQRAYRQPEAEVWMGLHHYFDRNELWPPAMQPLHRYLHHALASMTAGCVPSFGTPHDAELLADGYAVLAAAVNPRLDLTGGDSLAHVGLLLSQQSETFYFSRRTPGVFPRDYWYSVLGWHHLLMQNQITQELLFDADLTDAGLSRHPVVIAAQAVALSDLQLAILRRYVEAGGILITDGLLGACDDWGTPVPGQRASDLVMPSALPAPDASLANDAGGYRISELGKGRIIQLAGNPGLAFLNNHSPALSESLGTLLRHTASPQLLVEGPSRLHVALYRQRGRLLLHLHNFVAWSDGLAYPNPAMSAPPIARDVLVRLRMPVTTARALVPDCCKIDAEASADGLTIRIPRLDWGLVIEVI